MSTIEDTDIDAIVDAGRSPGGAEHIVASTAATAFTWDYERSRDGLSKLYEKAKISQWNVTTDLPWETEVDQERMATALGATADIQSFRAKAAEYSPDLAKWGEREWINHSITEQNSMLSQFLHGEQGALLCTAKIVETVPWIDAKYYASTQVMDEARHVEAFQRYLDEKFSGHLPINPHLGRLLDDIIEDTRWDITYLGMQIMVEGLALAAFGFIHQMTDEPLLKKLLRYVMSDEARHVAFGVLSLQELYADMNAKEIRERQEFAYEAVVRLRNRWFHTDVWEREGVDPRPVVQLMLDEPTEAEDMFRMMLFSKIVPNCKKLGLLDAGAADGEKGWLRERFEEVGIIQFEDWVDTSDEYADLDEVAKDRAAAGAA
ncbi:MAG: ferritin-like domain-containing protein [Microthrixaceae bacterium]